MAIEIRDAALEARIQRYLEVSGSNSVEELLVRLLDTQEEQDKWLAQNRDFIREKIERGMAQLDRGEVIPEDQLDRYLAEQKRPSK
jgi:predicted transcriptional regulator